MPQAVSFWIYPFIDLAKHVWELPEEFWLEEAPTQSDIDLLDAESKGSHIDKYNLRAKTMAAWRHKKDGLVLKVNTLPGRTRVIFIGTEDQWAEAPWSFWARCFQAIGHPVNHILWYANPSLRKYPEKGQPIESIHINGGYSYICQQSTVVIYRYEEATRVLLHELLHTACFDKEKHTEALEANTEAWTELFLCALLSRGKRLVFQRLWKQQLVWIYNQVKNIQIYHGVNSESDYAWRYITGKWHVLVEKGYVIQDINPALDQEVNTLRFTYPGWDDMLKIK